MRKIVCSVVMLAVSLLAYSKQSHLHHTKRSLQHLAVIMDGNRRWAQSHGLQIAKGYDQGAEAVRTVFTFCLEQQIPMVSLFVLSSENMDGRSSSEINSVMKLLINYIHKELPLFKKNGIRALFIGDRSLFPENVVEVIEQFEQETKEYTTLQVNFLFCYGARQELLHGVKTLAKKIEEGQLRSDELSLDLLSESLWTGDIPDPDLIIRTGNAQRLSNFLLYQAAYAELYFLNCLWPDLTNNHLMEALHFFQRTQRNFGA